MNIWLKNGNDLVEPCLPCSLTEWPSHYENRWPNFKPVEFQSRDGAASLYLDVNLLDSLQTLRKIAGKPIHIKSGYRTPSWNRAVGGVDNSQHVEGRAADIVITGMTVQQMAQLAERIPYFYRGGIGQYSSRGFLHVDVRMNGPARWFG